MYVTYVIYMVPGWSELYANMASAIVLYVYM